MNQLARLSLSVAIAAALSACGGNQVAEQVAPAAVLAGKSVPVELKVSAVEVVEEAEEEEVAAEVETPVIQASPKTSVDAIAQAPQPLAKAVDGADSRLGFASNLIYRSTAAKQIASSDQASAKVMHEEAKALYVQAQGVAGQASKDALNKALKLMFKAVKAAESDEVHAIKDRADYAKKEESVRALLKAHDMVAREKGDKAAQKKVQQQVDSLLGMAKKLLDQGKPAQGRGILDGALNTVKVSIESLRGGDTLVRSLSFESIEEEFEYELDRNDTHQMLVKALLAEKIAAKPALGVRVDKFVSKAMVFRAGADKLAAKHKYAEAIEELEKSTKELVRGIRTGGVYIPG